MQKDVNYSSHKKNVLKETENYYISDDDDGNRFESSYSEHIYIPILIDSWCHGGEPIHIAIMNELKLVIPKWWLLHIVNQDHLDQG